MKTRERQKNKNRLKKKKERRKTNVPVHVCKSLISYSENYLENVGKERVFLQYQNYNKITKGGN